MKRIMKLMFIFICMISVVGCNKENKVIEKINGSMKTYYMLENGNWSCDDNMYQYCLVIKGKLPNAACNSKYIYLSNIPDISFEQAYKAGGLSSNIDDYYSVKDAILVDLSTD